MNEVLRLSMMASLSYSAYLVYMCPCEQPVGCNKPLFYATTLIPVAVVTYCAMQNFSA